MKTVFDILPIDPVNADSEETVVQMVARIGSAYRAVFSANATQDDVDLVLVDLAQFTRYYDTAKIDATPEAVIAAAHRRAVLDHILDAIEARGGTTHGLRNATMRAPVLNEEI